MPRNYSKNPHILRQKTKFTLIGIDLVLVNTPGSLECKMVTKAKRYYREGVLRGDFYAYAEVDIIFYFSGITVACDYVTPYTGIIAHKSLKA